MKAIVIDKFGEPEVFHPAEVPTPEVRPGAVRIKIAAHSVNPVDFKIRSGMVPPLAPDFPAVLGCDVSGTIDAVGEGVSKFSEGDEVYGCIGGVKGHGGALAEYIVTDPALLAHKPKSLSLEDAATLPLVAITAWEALFDRAGVGIGQRVLVHGATGGVGFIGTQLAKAAGAVVTVTGSSDRKLGIGRELGADHAVNYKEHAVEDYTNELTEGEGYDVVFDTVGGDNLPGCFEAAGLNGAVTSISTRHTMDLSILHQKGQSLLVTFMILPLLTGKGRERHGEILKRLADMVDQGVVKPLIDEERFGFSEIAKAHRKLEEGRAIGKISVVADL